MRIAHLSDSHFDERARLQDVIDVHAEFVKQAKHYGAELILHTGDVYERKSAPKERQAVADFLIEASRIAPVVVVRGNHDEPGDLALFRYLRGEYPIYVADEQVETFDIECADDVRVVAIPWFDKAHLMAQAESRGQGIQTVNDVASRMLNSVASILKTNQPGHSRPAPVKIVAAHMMVAGSETSTGQLLIGDGIEAAPSHLADLGADYVALGHIHKTQVWYGGKVAYAGSPHRQNFGEIEEKGWRLVEIYDAPDFDRDFQNTFRRLPARERILIEHDIRKLKEPEGCAYDLQPPVKVSDALVRIRFLARAEQLPLISEGKTRGNFSAAEEVKFEIVVEPETRARTPEIVECPTVSDKVDVWLKAKGKDAQPSFFEKLAEVEHA